MTATRDEETMRDEEIVRTDIYLNYNGTCEAAFRFYEAHLGGQVTLLTTHATGPQNAQLPDGWRDKVLHARLQLGNAVLMGADIPGAEPMRSAYVTLTLETTEEAERVYDLLADGGQVFMKMEETFFASRFAMLRDRFGTSWMLLHERPPR
jgi:PhnB protein